MGKHIKFTEREEEIMRFFWAHGPMFIRELVQLYPEPRPHFNTVATFVRFLEAKGAVTHKAFGHQHKFYPLISEKEYSSSALRNVVSRYFNDSIQGAISALVGSEKLSEEEVRELIDLVQNSSSDTDSES